MKSPILIVVAAAALALGGCNRADSERTATVTPPGTTPGVPLAPPERGPVPPNANAAAPGTNATLAFAQSTDEGATRLPPSKGGSAGEQQVNVAAEEAAAMAPDTASGDAAKRAAQEMSSDVAATARDTGDNRPKAELTQQQESSEMPKAGQANNHSSTALDENSK